MRSITKHVIRAHLTKARVLHNSDRTTAGTATIAHLFKIALIGKICLIVRPNVGTVRFHEPR